MNEWADERMNEWADLRIDESTPIRKSVNSSIHVLDCVVSAGGVPQEGDPLFECTQGKPKTLLDIAGKPMVQGVVDALTGALESERIILVGLGPQDGITSPKLAAYIPDQGSLLRNAIAGVDRRLEINPVAQQGLMCRADIPLITPEIVDQFVGRCADPAFNIYYGVVARPLMESRFPGSRRSYVHLTDGDFAGADIFVIDPQVAYSNRQLWEDLIGGRKNALKQARRIGIVTLLKLLLRRLSLAEAEARVSKAMGLAGRAVPVTHAELGMDVDKPFQLEICQQELAGR